MVNQFFAQVFFYNSTAGTLRNGIVVAFVMFVALIAAPIESANAQLNEAVAASPFSVQGDNASVSQSAGQFSAARLQEYERQLNAVLKTRRVEERQFISQLVAQIAAGGVSTELVQTSFKWVRNRRPDTTFPFLYFERVLRIIAERDGVAANIPPFNGAIVGQPNPAREDNLDTDTNNSAGILIR